MSKPRYDWWTYVKGMIRRYPALHAQYTALHETTITAQLTGMPGGGSLSNPTATAALRELSPINQRSTTPSARQLPRPANTRTGRTG